MIHILLQFALPAAVALAFYRTKFLVAWLWMVAANLIDLDHLLATPIYDPNRCSIGFHPLHSFPIFLIYPVLLYFPKTRLLGIGFMIHLALDFADCWYKTGLMLFY